MKVAIIQGGPSAEAEVSRKSAAAVEQALLLKGHNVNKLELNQELPRALMDTSHDVVFPVVHGKLGEDGAVQGLLEILALPYVGSSVLACALACNKVQAKHAFRVNNLPVAEHHVLHLVDITNENTGPTIQSVANQFPTGVAIKPASQGSAIGISLVPNPRDTSALHHAITTAFQFDDVVLCEQLIQGREVTCGVLDTPTLGGLHPLPVTEIFSKAASWYDFQSRYATGGSVHTCPASLPKHVFERVQTIATAAHQALGCRDMSRVDFIVGDSNNPDAITLLEVNVIPGMTATSLFPEAAAASGIGFADLCDGLVRAAATRTRVKQVEIKPMPD
ncbi:MAG: D-alanine--D-alanine ligase [Polyangiaceae bacterium]|nr:D-alanine--D-alanine ligase [Polyangiaceae bacterium]